MTKGKDLEEEYFIRENVDSKHRMSEENQRARQKYHDEEERNLHYMKCPKCGHDLETKRLSYIDIDQCSSCGVLVLHPEDVDGFVAEERSILKAFIDFFKS